MRLRHSIAAALAVAALPLMACAQGAAPGAMYIFGDSFSDIGAGYQDGNGPTALAYLAADMKLDLTVPQDPHLRGKSIDFAVSGAPTGSHAARQVGSAKLGLGMENQVQDFARRVRSGEILFSPQNTLFYLAGGLNDSSITTAASIGNLTSEIRTLCALGAIHIRVAILPEDNPGFHAVAVRLNPAIEALPAQLAPELPDADIRVSAWGRHFDQVMEEPERFGIVDTTNQCAGRRIFGQDPTPCPNVEEHYFYHQHHPSTRVHRIVGNMLYIDLLAEGWAAPGQDPVAMALSPFWRSARQTETILPIQSQPGARPQASLLFHPSRILSVTSADGLTVYAPGKDYLADNRRGVITIPAGSRIPFRTRSQLEPTPAENLQQFAGDDPVKAPGLFYSEGAVYEGFQTSVEYDCRPGQWKGAAPGFAGDRLPRTMALLRAAKPLHLLVMGDSISAGYNASGYLGSAPESPAYPALTAAALQRVYGAPVYLRNVAVSGWRASDGAAQAAKPGLAETHPDLAIVAFGMNDVGNRNPSEYAERIGAILKSFRRVSPETEFILVAPMTANPQWAAAPAEEFPRYRDALQTLTGPGVVLADVTAVWQGLLARKTFFEMTGNGVNHPNDFGQRIYAQVVVAALVAGAR